MHRRARRACRAPAPGPRVALACPHPARRARRPSRCVWARRPDGPPHAAEPCAGPWRAPAPRRAVLEAQRGLERHERAPARARRARGCAGRLRWEPFWSFTVWPCARRRTGRRAVPPVTEAQPCGAGPGWNGTSEHPRGLGARVGARAGCEGHAPVGVRGLCEACARPVRGLCEARVATCGPRGRSGASERPRGRAARNNDAGGRRWARQVLQGLQAQGRRKSRGLEQKILFSFAKPKKNSPGPWGLSPLKTLQSLQTLQVDGRPGAAA